MATITSLLANHVTLQVRSVDRLFLQGCVPRLMTQGKLIRFLLDQGNPIPSPALLGKTGRGYVRQVDRFALEGDIPSFASGRATARRSWHGPTSRAPRRRGARAS